MSEGDADTKRRAPACDLVEDLPFVCVSSGSDNVHGHDAVLSIDLGGNDLYRNAAGGTFVEVAPNAYANTAVTLDLAGDDTYIAPLISFDGVSKCSESGCNRSRLHFVVAQGASVQSGLGLLLDASGNDTYRATPHVDLKRRDGLFINAQGAGIYNGSIGTLMDLAGNDEYIARGSRDDVGTSSVSAQGVTSGGICTGKQGAMGFEGYGWSRSCNEGLSGALIDTGGGADRYELDAGSIDTDVLRTASSGTARGLCPEGMSLIPSRIAIGQAGGFHGTAILADDGGADEFVAKSEAAHHPAMIPLRLRPLLYISAQGSGGWLLEGSGDTTYDINVRATGLAIVSADGQGTAKVGPGVLSDLGGDDRYSMRASLEYQREMSKEDDIPSPFSVNEWVLGMRIYGQGQAVNSGPALLEDAAGADRYEISGHTALKLKPHSQSFDQPALVAGFPVEVEGQGARGYTTTGALIDWAGKDSYSLASRKSVSASCAHGDAHEDCAGDVAVVNLGQRPLQGQGMNGILLDAGGTGDFFEAVQDFRTNASSGTQSEFTSESLPSVQGVAHRGFNGEHGFIALGQSPTVTSTPARPVCPPSTGQRGTGQWLGCQGEDAISFPDYGRGYAPLAAPVQQLDAKFVIPKTNYLLPRRWTSDFFKAHEGLRVELALGVGGHAAAGLRGQVHLQYKPCFYIDSDAGWLSAEKTPPWFTYWSTNLRRSVQGVATGRLPLVVLPLKPFNEMRDDWQWRLLATFEGDANRDLSPTWTTREIGRVGQTQCEL